MSLHPPGFIEPCLPTSSRTTPTGPQWAYEIKHDGFRFVCHRDVVTFGHLRRFFSFHLRLCRPPAGMVLGRLRHAPIEIREIPVELLEREGEGENAFGLVDRKGACQRFLAH